MPDTVNPNSSENVGCDEGKFRIWNATGFDIYAQGPLNRWTMWILDVERPAGGHPDERLRSIKRRE